MLTITQFVNIINTYMFLGIGFEIALHLARRNGRIILACRNSEKGEAARSRIVQLSGNSNVVFRLVDVSMMSSVRAFVDVIKREEKKVDILINNAGVVSTYWQDFLLQYSILYNLV